MAKENQKLEKQKKQNEKPSKIVSQQDNKYE